MVELMLISSTSNQIHRKSPNNNIEKQENAYSDATIDFNTASFSGLMQ